MNDEINLLSGKKSGQNTMLFKQAQVLRLAAIVILFSVSVISFMLFILIAFSPLPRLQREEQDLLASLTGTSNGEKLSKYYSTQNRLSDVSALLKKRTDLVAISNALRSNLSEDASIDILKVEGKTVYMTVTGPTLDSIDASIVKLQGAEKNTKLFKDFSISRINYNTGSGSYFAYFQITLA